MLWAAARSWRKMGGLKFLNLSLRLTLSTDQPFEHVENLRVARKRVRVLSDDLHPPQPELSIGLLDLLDCRSSVNIEISPMITGFSARKSASEMTEAA